MWNQCLDRLELLRRIETSEAGVIALIAPPGYGRTTLANELADRDARRARRDFRTDVAGLGDVLIGLERDLATGPGTIVLDNLDVLERGGDDFSLLLAFIAKAPKGTRFVLCSLSAPAFLQEYPPHEVLVLGPDDLSFTDSECAQVFAGIDGAAAAAPSIRALTGGWPVAVLMLLRYARENGFQQALARSDDLIDALTGYLVANVFSLLPPGRLEDMLRTAVIPYAGVDDLYGDALPPFVQLKGSKLSMHPLVRAVLIRRYASRCAVIQAETAETANREGDWERAAACALEAGDVAGAAAALEAVDPTMLSEPSKIYNALLARIDPLYHAAYPNVWASGVRMRRFVTSPATLLFEAKSVWASVSEGSTPFTYAAVGCAYAQLLADAGQDSAGIDLLKSTPWPAEVLPMVNLVTARLLARAGRFAEGQQRWTEGLRNGSSLLSEWLTTLYEAPRARAYGNVEDERDILQRSVALAEQSEHPTRLQNALAEASFSGWLAGDDVRRTGYLARLHATLEISDNATFRAFHDAMYGLRPKVPAAMPAWRARADLVRCTYSTDVETAGRAARDALNASREACNPFLTVLSALAVAALTPSLRAAMIAEAKAAAAQIESAPLMEAVAAFERHETGVHMLTPFVAYLQLLTAHNADALTLNFFRGVVTWRGSTHAISQMGLALVFALGSAPARTREDLYEMLWPTLNEKAAATALRMCVYRVRNQLSEGPVIVATRDGYALDVVAVRDMPLLESALHRARSDQPLEQTLRERLIAALRDVYAGRSPSLVAYEWWEQIEASILRFAETIAMRLALDAMLRGEFDEALTVGTTLLAHDACSETGCEILVRTNLARGDRDGAERSIRVYERALKSELDVDTAPRLRTLLAVG